MPTRPALVAVALALLLGAGCGPPKLDESRTYTISAGEIQGIDVGPISKPRTLKVEFTATTEVTVLVMKEQDASGDAGLFAADEKKALGKNAGKGGDFTVEVPEKTGVRIFITNVKSKTEATLKVFNAK